MPEGEHRAALGELRVEGRTLSGTVMRYGEVSPSHRERFEPGAFRMAESVVLDLAHNREKALAWSPGGGLELVDGDGSLELTAELPPIPAADRALDEIRAGKNDGPHRSNSVPMKESRVDGGMRVIEEAELSRRRRFVARPSYAGLARRSAGEGEAHMALTEAQLGAITATVAARIRGSILGREATAAGTVEMEIAGAAVAFCHDIAPAAPEAILREASDQIGRMALRQPTARRRA